MRSRFGGRPTYTSTQKAMMPGKKHTTLNLHQDVLHEAQEILGTHGATETIHEALREVIRRHDRRVLPAYDFPGLTPEWLKQFRRAKEFDTR
jgi:Arc/MetJ family transcription regulator